MSGLLFNTLFNMNKFLAYENRDPFAMRAEQMSEEGGQSDWDRWGGRQGAMWPAAACCWLLGCHAMGTSSYRMQRCQHCQHSM
jgi:hypothetical protein